MIELLNIDCMEYMATVPDKYFDLAICDPPYQNNDAIGIKNSKKHSANRKDYHLFQNIKPTDEYFVELKRITKNQIIWGGNFFGLSGGGIVWNKNGTAFGEAEYAYCSIINSIRIFEYTWNGMLQQNMKEKEVRIHPTQKPVQLYKWLMVNYASPDFKIIDTHLGSGSSAIAAYDFGIAEFVGCEIDKEYYDAAMKRFNTHKLQQTLAF